MKINYWDHAAVSLNDEEVKESILAGYRDGKPFEPDALQVTWPVGMRSIVDYGCGLGRNWPLLLQHAQTVYAFDRPAMLVRAVRSPLPDGVVPSQFIHTLGPVDLIFMSLVLQHIERDVIEDVWHFLPPHHYLHVHGRARHDESGPTFALVPRSLYTPLQIIDTGSHERVDESTLRRLDDERHFEVLYRQARDGD